MDEFGEYMDVRLYRMYWRKN